jgi:hypothetical protein
MVNNLGFLCGCLLALGWVSVCSADIYRAEDKNGQVAFSDQPTGQAHQPAQLPAIINIPPLVSPEQKKSIVTGDNLDKAKPAFTNYAKLVIASPRSGTSFHQGSGDVKVRVAISPTLKPQHWLQLILDGRPWGQAQTSLDFQLINIGRGSHIVAVQVINQAGKVLQTSPVVTLYIHRSSKLLPPKKKKSAD